MCCDYRQYAKLKSTYVDGLLKVIDPDGRVRTSFQMTVTATGRLSAPRSQTSRISPPARSWAASCGGCSCAPEGCVLVDADYSQIELRLLAHIAGDDGDAGGVPLRGGFPHRHRLPACSMWRRRR